MNISAGAIGQYLFDDVSYNGKSGRKIPLPTFSSTVCIDVQPQSISFYKKSKSGEKKDEVVLKTNNTKVNIHHDGDHDNLKMELVDIVDLDPSKEIVYNFTFENSVQKNLCECAIQKVIAEANKDNMKTTLDIWAGSWNMGDASPGDDLSVWIEKDHDLYAIGCQESSWNGGGDCEEKIASLITNALGPKYAVVEQRSMGAIRIFIVARRVLLPFITSVMSSDEATGVAHVASNKGGCAVYLQYLNSSFTFVCSHLAAHQEKVDERNANVVEILQGVRVGPYSAMDLMACSDHVFWMGDLNYRIDLDRDEVIKLAAAKNYAKLYEADQLRKEMAADKVFYKFRETAPNFAPSYKYEVGTKNYATEKMRVPSWCDRVLEYSRDSTNVKAVAWRDCDGPLTSDHVPVMATYEVAVQQYCMPNDAEMTAVVKGELKKKLKIKALKGESMIAMDRGNSSDPYVIFHGPTIAKDAKTDIVKKTLFPEWNMFAFPALELTTPWRRCYDGMHLVASVWDADIGSKDDAMGWCTIPLTELALKDSCTFKVPVYLFGKQCGSLSGELSLV